MSECQQCGRELPSHHLGCAAAGKPRDYNDFYDSIGAVPVAEPEFDPEDETAITAFEDEQVVCAADGCQDAPKPYAGRGPRPKFCAAHSNGKGK